MKRIPALATLLLVLLAAPSAAQTPPAPGALTGKRIFISPGHGYYWHSTLGWTTQRPLINGLIEDIHTNEIVIDHLFEYLEGAGARPISARERGFQFQELVVDNDGPAANYAETGIWTTGSSTGYLGLTYRFANTWPTETATATWSQPIAVEGLYPVYAYFRAGTNRVTDATYRVVHSGGVSPVKVNQKIDGLRWVYLGSWTFFPGETAQVVLSNASSEAGVVIADAVRIGAGLGSIVRGGTTSGQPRWKECCRYWAEFIGAPASVWNPCATGQDNCDDVTCRPFLAEWFGADAFVSLHTNASAGGTASGTSTYIYNGGATPGSPLLQSLIHNQIVADIQAEWDPSWPNLGLLQANFGEVRELSTMPGCLVELAFHDNVLVDNPYLHEPEFRRIGARAIYRGLSKYFAPSTPTVLEPPKPFALVNEPDGTLRAKWAAVPGATGYVLYRSPNGKAFDDGTLVPGGSTTEHAISVLDLDEVVFAKLAAANAGGVGPATEVLAARAAKGGPAPVLLVSGFDRFDAFVLEEDNTLDFPRRHAEAIEAAASAGYAFDGASNEAIPTLVALPSYSLVDWILGEESTADETFSSAEQSLVSFALGAGTNLFFSGAEVGWDLDFLGSVPDRNFYQLTLGHNYVADDAGTYTVLPPLPASLFAGIAGFSFDNGSFGSYDVDFPDVVAPYGFGGTTELLYAGGASAAVRYQAPTYEVIGFGFPIETIIQGNVRAQLMERILGALADLPIPVQDPIAPGASRNIPIHLPGSSNLDYLVTGSLGNSPGIPVDADRVFPLNADALFFLLATPGNPALSSPIGVLDPQGMTTVALTIPPIPALSGFVFYLAAASFSGASVQEISNWVRIEID
jgi:N-acetylmuramoyl-L-alanine amidase